MPATAPIPGPGRDRFADSVGVQLGQHEQVAAGVVEHRLRDLTGPGGFLDEPDAE